MSGVKREMLPNAGRPCCLFVWSSTFSPPSSGHVQKERVADTEALKLGAVLLAHLFLKRNEAELVLGGVCHKAAVALVLRVQLEGLPQIGGKLLGRPRLLVRVFHRQERLVPVHVVLVVVLLAEGRSGHHKGGGRVRKKGRGISRAKKGPLVPAPRLVDVSVLTSGRLP